MNTLTIDARFNGPRNSGNGGFVAGSLARALNAASAEVTLRAPAPLGRPLTIRPTDHGGIELLDGETLLAQAHASPLDLQVPAAPTLEAARVAGALGRMRASQRPESAYAHCFGCGIVRGDGLRLRHGPTGDDGVVASDWTPSAELADENGEIPMAIVWTVLDCPAGLSWGQKLGGEPAMLTGRMASRIDAPLRAGEPCVVIGWPIARDGRKIDGGAAIFDSKGSLVAVSLQRLILPRE